VGAEANGNSPLPDTAEAVACGYMVAAPRLALLEAEAKGLGLTFYRVLAASLAKWMRVYDYSMQMQRGEAGRMAGHGR